MTKTTATLPRLTVERLYGPQEHAGLDTDERTRYLVTGDTLIVRDGLPYRVAAVDTYAGTSLRTAWVWLVALDETESADYPDEREDVWTVIGTLCAGADESGPLGDALYAALTAH